MKKTISISNFHELFTAPCSQTEYGQISYGSEYKAIIWPNNQNYCLVSNSILDFRHEFPYTPYFIPEYQLNLNDLSCQTTKAFVNSTQKMNQLIDYVKGADSVELVYTIFTDGIKKIADILKKAYPNLEIQGVPECTPSLIRYWNTKIGGRDLLMSVPDAAYRLPKSSVCNSLAECVTMLAGLPGTSQFMIKTNMGVGGTGVVPVWGRDSELIKKFNKSVRESTSKCVWGSHNHKKEPFLIEEITGDLSTNLSVTADFEVIYPNKTRIEGIGLQLLKNGTQYYGMHGYPEAITFAIRNQIESTGRAIGKAMSLRKFTGYFNIDFIITESDDLFLSEINVRRSAPLDQFIILRRLFGDNWANNISFYCREDYPLPNHCKSVANLYTYLNNKNILFNQKDGVIPLSNPVARNEKYTAALLIVAQYQEILKTLLLKLNNTDEI